MAGDIVVLGFLGDHCGKAQRALECGSGTHDPLPLQLMSLQKPTPTSIKAVPVKAVCLICIPKRVPLAMILCCWRRKFS